MPHPDARLWWSANSVWVKPLLFGVPVGLLLSASLTVFVFLTLKQGWDATTAAILVPSSIGIIGSCCAGVARIPQMKAREKERREVEAKRKEEKERAG